VANGRPFRLVARKPAPTRRLRPVRRPWRPASTRPLRIRGATVRQLRYEANPGKQSPQEDTSWEQHLEGRTARPRTSPSNSLLDSWPIFSRRVRSRSSEASVYCSTWVSASARGARAGQTGPTTVRLPGSTSTIPWAISSRNRAYWSEPSYVESHEEAGMSA